MTDHDQGHLERLHGFQGVGLVGGHDDHLAGLDAVGLPAIVTSAWPSRPKTRASKGAVCSLKPSPWSKAKTVTVPVLLAGGLPG